jgi:hypothetical protein
VVNFTPQPLCSRGKMDRSLGGPQRRSGRRGEEKILDPTGNRTPTPRSSSLYPVAIPTILAPIGIEERHENTKVMELRGNTFHLVNKRQQR